MITLVEASLTTKSIPLNKTWNCRHFLPKFYISVSLKNFLSIIIWRCVLIGWIVDSFMIEPTTITTTMKTITMLSIRTCTLKATGRFFHSVTCNVVPGVYIKHVQEIIYLVQHMQLYMSSLYFMTTSFIRK